MIYVKKDEVTQLIHPLFLIVHSEQPSTITGQTQNRVLSRLNFCKYTVHFEAHLP